MIWLFPINPISLSMKHMGLKAGCPYKKTIDYHETYPAIFTIADAKRGDIGNTSSMYAKAFFEDLNFDSVTVAPYMGKDSVEPFLAFETNIQLCLP
jgi:orotidine-5'-phosphate decarboxylase